MCDLKKEINDKITNLSNNVMFRLSLESKELFHSNFLAWVFEKYYQECSKLFKIDINPNMIKREKLIGKTNGKKCVADIDINDSSIVIENKFKSLPDKQQLNNYRVLLNEQQKTNSKIILLSFIEPSFDYEDKWSYDIVKQNLESLLDNIKDETHKFYIKQYTGMLNLLLELRNLISLKIQKNETFSSLYSKISNCEIEASKINCFKFFQKLFFFQLGSDLYNDINNTTNKKFDWVSSDVSQSQEIYLDIMISLLGFTDVKQDYSKQQIKDIGITIAENESRFRHYISIGKIENEENRDDIENRLISDLTRENQLLNWFYSNCESKGNNNFWGYNNLSKNDKCCWLYKRSTNDNEEFQNQTYEKIKTRVEKKIDEIRQEIQI